jgi:hypothetical protein
MRFPVLLAAIIVLVSSVNTLALNGKALTVVNNFLAPMSGPQDPNSSRMIVVTTQSVGNVTSIVKTDTILRGRLYYPTWSFDGKRVAYYKRGAGVCIADADGKNERTVAMMHDMLAFGYDVDLFWALAWPGVDGGKYLYYHKTCNGGESECYYSCSGEIWKVNVDDTAQKTFVCDFTKSNKQIAGDNGLPYLARFQMSADAKYAAIHAGGGPSLNVWGYANGCIPFTFPPKTNPGTTQINPSLTQPSCEDNNCLGYQGACNAALSTSGAIFYHFGGAHVCLYAHYWNHTTNSLSGTYTVGTGPANSLDMGSDIEGWLSTGPANSMDGALNWPRGTSNSDRVVTVLTPWIYTSSYAQMGCNMVVADWKDKKAAMVTYCPKPELAGPNHNWGWAVEGTRWWFAEPGDFWVSGGPAGCYQAIDGSWVNVTTGVATPIGKPGSIARVNTQSALRGAVAVFDLRGARVGSRANGMTNHAPNSTGVYIAVCGNGSPARRVMFSSDISPTESARGD